MTDVVVRLGAALAERYVIERELGAGGMATVYLAHDVRHDRKVALKVLRPELSAILGAERFLKEIRTTANLQHPHILPLHDSGAADGTVYYVMPFVEGESLRDRLVREQQLPVDDAVRIAREVLDALAYAHTQGVIHRDIKPENILLYGGHALVADFGIALAASRSEGSKRLTETGMSLGTPAYMAPEQAMGERAITPRVDLYAVGCVLYEMLSGEPPFTGPTAQAIVARVMTEEPRALTLHRHTIPAHVEAAVRAALEKLPADRFATAAEFAGALASAEGLAVLQRAGAARPAASRRDWRSRAAVPALAVAAAASVVAAWAMLRPAPEPPVIRYELAIPAARALGFNPLLAVAPDGARFVYAGPSDAGPFVPQLWLKARDRERAVPLPATVGTGGVASATFSPDGRWIAFGLATSLRKLQIGGGAAITLADSMNALVPPAWLDDGTIVYVAVGGGLRRIPDGGGRATVVWPADSGAIRGVRALPGGRGVLVVRCATGNCAARDVWVIDLRTGRGRLVVAGGFGAYYLPTGHVLFVRRDGAALALPFDLNALEPRGDPVPVIDSVAINSVNIVQLDIAATGTLVMLRDAPAQDARHRIVWVDRGGAESPIDLGGSVQLSGFGNAGWELSPDGRRLAISLIAQSGGSSNESAAIGGSIWVKELPAGPLTRVTLDSAGAVRPRWRRDGRALIYVALGQQQIELRSVVADGSGSAAVVARGGLPGRAGPAGPGNAADLYEGAISPDGSWIVARTSGGVGRQGRDIVGFRAGDSVPVPLIANPAYDEAAFALSPDGRWIAFESDESGRREVYVRPFPETSRGRWQVSTAGGMAPLWSRDGRELFFVDGARRMTAVAVSGTAEPRFGERRPLFALSPDDYLDDNTYYTPHDVGPDGRFVMARRIRGASESQGLIVVENWFTELRRQLSGRP